MRVNIAHATPPSSPSYSVPSSLRIHRSKSSVFTPLLNFSSPKSPPQKLHRTCNASFDNHEFLHPLHNPTPKQHTHEKNIIGHIGSNNNKHKQLSPGSRVDLLEPSFLGIRPEPPDWPARDEMIRDCIARRASSIEIPVSLRMIKMKQKFLKLEEGKENGDYLGESMSYNSSNPISNLCCSTLYIIKEVQSHALKIRGSVLDENLDGIVSKVQKEMTSSFVWLFREVFAKTPDLMLQVMVLTSCFATHSIGSYQSRENSRLEGGEILERNSRNWGIEDLELGRSGVPTREILEEMDEREVGLWNSMVEEVRKRKNDHGKDEALGFAVTDEHDLMERTFVSPVTVQIECDDYEEYHKTDLLYQIGLSQEPNNSLLLSNYAQFLRLVSHDYDRAEECFKRAIQSSLADAEVISQYASFLWVVRKDVCGADEQFQQAMAVEPSNSYHSSKYASFLWSTGSEDVCHIFDPHQVKS